MRLLQELLPSLAAQTQPCDVIVIDNASTDETPKLLASWHPAVTRVEAESNLGFAAAVNLGVAATEAAVVVVVNNDVVCEPGFVERLCERLEPRDGVVMAAGVLLDAARPATIDTAGIAFDRTLFAVEYLHGEHISVLELPVADPLGPSGGAAAFDRAAFDGVGGFDEHFFAYLEDVDLVARLRVQGGRCRLAPDARALHRHSATLGSRSRKKNELMGWGRGYTIAKYRLHRRPRAFARAAAAELVIVCGQLVVDQTVTGLTSRVAGFRAGLRVPAAPVPSAPTPRLGALLGQRFRRRLPLA